MLEPGDRTLRVRFVAKTDSRLMAAAGNQGWYAMDVEFKFDGEPGETPKLAIKQARPHPGRGQ